MNNATKENSSITIRIAKTGRKMVSPDLTYSCCAKKQRHKETN